MQFTRDSLDTIQEADESGSPPRTTRLAPMRSS